MVDADLVAIVQHRIDHRTHQHTGGVEEALPQDRIFRSDVLHDQVQQNRLGEAEQHGEELEDRCMNKLEFEGSKERIDDVDLFELPAFRFAQLFVEFLLQKLPAICVRFRLLESPAILFVSLQKAPVDRFSFELLVQLPNVRLVQRVLLAKADQRIDPPEGQRGEKGGSVDRT